MAQQTRAGGLPGFVVSAENLQVVLKELRALEPNLRKELVAEMKRDVKPIGTDLLSKIPGAPPLSGFSPSRGDSPYIWRKPRMLWTMARYIVARSQAKSGKRGRK